MQKTTNLQEIFKLAMQLSTLDKIRLLEKLAPQIEKDFKKISEKKPKSLRGLWKGINITSDDIEQARSEMSFDFPRKDIL